MTKLSHLLVLTSILNCFAATAASKSLGTTNLEQYPYYPKGVDSNLAKIAKSKKSIKSELKYILTSGHVRSAGSNDILVESCADKKNCFKQEIPNTYKQARKYLFGDIYLQGRSGNYKVKDVYCNQDVGESAGVGPMLIPNHQVMNCEHSWPQSRFNKRLSTNTQKNDLHHLFPVNSRANSSRSNHPFGEVNGRTVNSNCTDSHIGQVNYKDESTTSFEPPQEIRGNIARALFYFSTRYELPIGEAQEYYLRRWHKEDPVDEFEMNVNNRIYEIQNSRNPFIDDEDLVDAISNF